MKDKDLIFFVKNQAKKTAENKYSGKYISISNINTRSNITSYTLAQFVGEYLYTY